MLLPEDEGTDYAKWYLSRYVTTPEQLKEKTLKEIFEEGKRWAENTYLRDENIRYMSTRRAIELGYLTINDIVNAFKSGLESKEEDELLQFADDNPIPQKWYDEEPIKPPQKD